MSTSSFLMPDCQCAACKLISELLAALEAVDKQFENLSQREWLDQVRAAIRKAKGEL